jgi:hypothetical protein
MLDSTLSGVEMDCMASGETSADAAVHAKVRLRTRLVAGNI